MSFVLYCIFLFSVFILGIYILIRGRLLLSRVKEVRGWPARIVGTLLIVPLPLNFLAALALLATLPKGPFNSENEIFVPRINIVQIALMISWIATPLCIFAAIGVAVFNAESIRKNRPEQIEAVIPDNYDERFQAAGRDDSNSQDITGGSSHPPIPPDDRIRS